MVPLPTVRSSLPKPVMASEKVKVTSEVSPADKAVSVTTIELSVGATVSVLMVTVLLTVPRLPVGSV